MTTDRVLAKPTTCGRCRLRFEDDYLLQAEIRHLAMTLGRSTAEGEINERYGDWHAGGHRG